MPRSMDMRAVLETSTPNSPEFAAVLEQWDKIGRVMLREVLQKVQEAQATAYPGPRHQKDIEPQLTATTETAYERAFFLHSRGDEKCTVLQRTDTTIMKIKWLDMEVPVARVERSDKRFDMVGIFDGNYILAELKDVNGNSPFDATFEVLEYACLIRRIIKSNKRLPIYHGDRDYWAEGPYQDCKYLIVGAPKSYWMCWSLYIDELHRLATWISEENKYGVIFASFEDEQFVDQKNEKGGKGSSYTPELKINKGVIWTEK